MCRARTTAWLGIVVVMSGTVQVRACGPDGLCAGKEELLAALQDYIRNGPRDGWRPIGEWDVGLVTDMSNLFYRAANTFNGDLSGWNVGQVTNMDYMFSGAANFSGDLSGWNVGNVTSMAYMFSSATIFNGDLSAWNVGNVTNMQGMFYGAPSFNGDLSGWDVGSITTMYHMFFQSSNFNGDLSGWNVGQVTSMGLMFYGATSFNGDLSGWNVGNVTSMYGMFYGATNFNGNLSGWNVGNVTSTSSMFEGATSFNGDVSSWNVGSVVNMGDMFNRATSFDGDLSAWNVSNVNYRARMFNAATSFHSETQCNPWNTGGGPCLVGEWPQTLSPTPAPTINYCPGGYADYGVRYNWGLGKVTIATTHQACADRCTQYSAPQYNGGCKGYMTGMFYGMLYCKSYGGNLQTTACAPFASPVAPGFNSGQIGSVSMRTNIINVGGNCCMNTTFVEAVAGR